MRGRRCKTVLLLLFLGSHNNIFFKRILFKVIITNITKKTKIPTLLNIKRTMIESKENDVKVMSINITPK